MYVCMYAFMCMRVFIIYDIYIYILSCPRKLPSRCFLKSFLKNVSKTFPETFFKSFLGRFLRVSTTFPDRFLNVSQTFPERFLGHLHSLTKGRSVSQAFPASFRNVSWTCFKRFLERFLNVSSNVFQAFPETLFKSFLTQETLNFLFFRKLLKNPGTFSGTTK